MSVAFERAPETRFANLPELPYEPRYLDWQGLRLARIDEGTGSPIVLLHGEPTWSFLWRRVMGPLLDAGHRCIAPDMPGFGRSDKPTDLDWYSYDRHNEAMLFVLDELDVRDATLVVHDWGGPVGLRAAVERPERIGRIVVLDTGVFTGRQRMAEAWHRFRDFVEQTEDLPISALVAGGTKRALSPEVLAAYDAPFPTPASKAGARAFPLMIPLSPDDPGAEAGRRVTEALRSDSRPKLALWAAEDPVIPLEGGRRVAAALGIDELEVIEDAAHFLQEDQGPVVGERIAGWLAEQEPPRSAPRTG